MKKAAYLFLATLFVLSGLVACSAQNRQLAERQEQVEEQAEKQKEAIEQAAKQQKEAVDAKTKAELDRLNAKDKADDNDKD